MSNGLSTDNQIVAAIRKIIRAVDLQSRRLVSECDLTGPQLLTLQTAARMGRTSIGALARAVHLSQPTVTGIIDRLERRGLVERLRDERDRRSVTVDVTVKGHRLVVDAPSLLQDRFRRELSRLEDWEQSMILATLQRIAFMMDADAIDASPLLATGPINASEASGRVETERIEHEGSNWAGNEGSAQSTTFGASPGK